jgi:hypothetical protein
MASIQQTDQTDNLLIETSEYLTGRLRRAQIWLYRVFEESGKVVRFPGKVRGNRAYAFSQRGRVDEIQAKLNQLIETGSRSDTQNELTTNAVFATLTVPNPLDAPDTLERLAADFASANVLKSRFFKNLRRRGLLHYVWSVEATARGGFHIHAVLIFDRQLRTWKDGEGRSRSDEARELVARYWPHNIDVQAMTNADVAGYVTKELRKVASAEDPLRRYSSGEEISAAERKRIITFALAHYSRARLLGTSRSLPALEEDPSSYEDGTDEEEPDLRLDEIGNNAPEEPSQTLLFTRRDLLELLGDLPPPFTGEVERGSAEHTAILQLARDRRAASSGVQG